MLDSPARADDRFRQLVELSPDAIFIGRDGLIEYANPAALQLVGAPTPDLVVGRSPLAFVAESSRPHVEFLIAEVLSGRPVTGVEEQLVRPDGTVVDVEMTGVRFADDRGEGVQVIVRDISERRRIQASLHESEERLRLAFAGSREGVWDWTLETGAVVYSSHWAAMLGYDDRELEPHVRTWERLLHPDDRWRADQALQAVLGGASEYAGEFRLQHKAGHYVDVLSRGFPVRREPGGPVVRIVGTHFDLSERKRAEAALRADERRLRAFLENSAVAGWLKDEDGRYVFVSENFERLGTPMDEWLGRTDADLWPADVADGFRRNDVAVLGGSGSIEVVEEAIARDGSRSWWLNHKFLFVDATGRRYVGGLGVDVTARVMAEEQLRQAHDELDRRVKERTAELASANASLQQQIEERERMDQARLDLLARLVFAQEDERRRIAREMHDQFGEQLTALGVQIRDLKTVTASSPDLLSRAQALERVAQALDHDVDQMVWALRPTALDDLGLRAALANYVQDWSGRVGVAAELHSAGLAAERLSTEVETTLYRIAQEALTNVAKHARARNVAVLLERRADHVSMVIEDDGVGFDPGTRTSMRDGSFGLLGMQERAALVGASLEIESAVGRGTSIIVRIATPTRGSRA